MVGKDSVSAHHGKSSARSLASVKVPPNSGSAAKPKEGTPLKLAGVAKTGVSTVVAKTDLRNKPRKSPGSSAGTSEVLVALPPLLCADCKAASTPAPKVTICFMGNNGRASAFPAQLTDYVCKSPKCPNFDNPVSVAPPSEPKKYLVSKRHQLKAQPNPKVRTKPSNKGILIDKSVSTMIVADDESDGKSDKSQGSVTTTATATATMATMNDRKRVNGLPNKDGTMEELMKVESMKMDGKSDKSQGLMPVTATATATVTTINDRRRVNGLLNKDGTMKESMKMEPTKMESAKMDGISDKSQVPEITITTARNNRRVNGLLNQDGTVEESMSMDLTKMELTEMDRKPNKSQGLENKSAMNDRRRVNGLPNECGKMGMELMKMESTEAVKLRKQGNIEPKKEGTVLNNAIEGAVQKLAPSRENRVKVLVEAFESIISNHDDGDDETAAAAARDQTGNHNHNHRLRHLARGAIECHGTSHHNVATRC